MEEHTGDHLMASPTVRVWPELRASKHKNPDAMPEEIL